MTTFFAHDISVCNPYPSSVYTHYNPYVLDKEIINWLSKNLRRTPNSQTGPRYKYIIRGYRSSYSNPKSKYVRIKTAVEIYDDSDA